MKCLLLSLLMAWFSSSSLANDNSYDWVLDQYKNDEKPEITAHANGSINGVEHIAVILSQAPPLYQGPLILLYKKVRDRNTLIMRIDLHGDYATNYNLYIKNDSLYLENVVGHHGWNGARYQFKQVDGKFKMIGVEFRSEALGCYAGDDSPRCNEYEAWSGTSYNLITSSATCWRTTFVLHNKREPTKETSRKNYWQQPRGAVSHAMSFQPVNLPLLDKFNFFEFSLPKACYFDHRNKVKFDR